MVGLFYLYALYSDQKLFNSLKKDPNEEKFKDLRAI